jgi:hypothetical protein
MATQVAIHDKSQRAHWSIEPPNDLGTTRQIDLSKPCLVVDGRRRGHDGGESRVLTVAEGFLGDLGSRFWGSEVSGEQ